MRWLIFVIPTLVLILLATLIIKGNDDNLVPGKKADISEKSEIQTEKTFLFVPEWTINNAEIESENYDTLLYFGVGVTIEGIDREDSGYLKIAQFIQFSDSRKERMLVVRMIDTKLNSEITKNDIAKKNIISDSINIAKQYSFDGIVLDFETSAIGFPLVSMRISDFYEEYYNAVKKEGLLFYATIFGDTIYRGRPYELSIISKNADKIIIMAYDFHKSRGNPGPNFPLGGENVFGYSFKRMIADITKDIEMEKIVVAFGFFGYDWKVDGKGNSISQGEPLSLNQANARFVSDCRFDKCVITRNEISSEMKITYVDTDKISHEVWFEDQESAREKTEFLKSQGLNQIAHWAYSFF